MLNAQNKISPPTFPRGIEPRGKDLKPPFISETKQQSNSARPRDTREDGGIKSRVGFLMNFLKDINVASVTPSAKRTVESICKKLPLDRVKTVVEYGPGDGVFTKEILKRINKNATLIVIETNPDFCKTLGEISDPRLVIVNSPAENVKNILNSRGIKRVDLVLSGIPLSHLSKPSKTKLIGDTYEILEDGGIFFVYQFRLHAKKYLELYFRDVKISFEPLNIPPLFTFQAQK